MLKRQDSAVKALSCLSRVFFSVVLLGCEPSDDGQASRDPNEGETFSETINAIEGGTVATAGHTATVTIPPGALTQDTAISIAVAARETGTATNVYDLGPDGIRFNAQVSIAVSYDGRPPNGKKAVLAWKDGDVWTKLPGSSANGGKVKGQTTHFTSFSVILVDEDGDAKLPWDEGMGDESSMTYSTWTDSASGLTWQYPTAVNWMGWQEAVNYCANLPLEGGGWHLPTIGELRTLIRNCPATEPMGTCGVTDACLELFQCWGDSDACNGCADGGCNWDPALFYEAETSCLPPYWSSSTYHAVDPNTGKPFIEDGEWAWGVMFAGGAIVFSPKVPGSPMNEWKVRCVRGGL
jgi:hypothetical protein